MTKGELWEVFLKTGSVKDYLRYKKAEASGLYDKDESNLTELSNELYEDLSQQDD